MNNDPFYLKECSNQFWRTELWIVHADLGHEHSPGKSPQVPQDIAVQTLALSPQFDGSKCHSKFLDIRNQTQDQNR